MKLAYVCAAVLLLASPSAFAATQSFSFDVGTIIGRNCTLSVPTALDFGSYETVGANLTTAKTAQATINVKCTWGTGVVQVAFGKGTSPRASDCNNDVREMFLNGDSSTASTYQYVGYSIYKDSALSVKWGCAAGTGANGSMNVGPFISSLQPISVPVYGQVNAGKTSLLAGSYTDSVNIWVTF